MTEIKLMKDVPVPMRDGLNLAANVYLPDTPGKYPVIMAFTPFGKDVYWNEKNYGWGQAYEPWSPTITGSITFEANDPEFWCHYGYAIMIVDPRGCNRSPGTFPVAELDGAPGEQANIGEGRWARDQYDAIEWAGVQDWSNGNVALSGVSVYAFSQWRVAGMNPPHLKCLNPWEGMTDYYRDCMAPGGIRETEFTNPVGHHGHRTATFPPAWEAPENEDPPKADLKTEDEFLPLITQPTLICGNWADHGCHTRGSFKAFRLISSEQKWLYTHGHQKWGEFYCSEARTYRKWFFDHFLKGSDDRILRIPKVSLAIMDTMDVYSLRFEDDYPIPGTEAVKFFLSASDNGMHASFVPEEGNISYDSGDGHAAFEYTFTEDTELIGPSALKIWVSAEETEDMDLFATLRKFDREDREIRLDSVVCPRNMPVAVGWMRASLRELDPDISTPQEPYQKRVIGPGEKIKPGEIVPCEIAVWPAGMLFKAGEKMRVEIAGKYRSGDAAAWQEFHYQEPTNKGLHTVYTGGKYDSYFIVPLKKKRQELSGFSDRSEVICHPLG